MGRKGITSIQIYPETRDDLKKLGSKNETYDQVIRRLIKISRNSNSDDDDER